MTSFFVSDLRTERRTNPLGIDVLTPRLSWKLATGDDTRRGLRQSAYQVLAATRPELLTEGQADLWDSGRVESDNPLDIVYAGKALGSRDRAYWTVRVWDETVTTADLPEAAHFEIGLLDNADWQGAQWIGGPLVGGKRTTIPCPYLRKTFTLDSVPADTRLYITALGLYEAYINGKRVGDDELTPGWTDYKVRVQYQVYDVTEYLTTGENVLAVTLGDGWYTGHVAWHGRQGYGDTPKLLATLTSPALVSDSSWKVTYGPLLESDMLMGESYDARLEMPGWNKPGFEDSAWLPVAVFDDPGILRSSMVGPTVKATQEIHPVSDPVHNIFDMGQNMVGKVRLKVKGPAGMHIRLRYVEVLKDGPKAELPGGGIYIPNLRSALQTDYYTLKGDPDGEVFETRFTFHGFRYVEVTGSAEKLTRDSLVGIVLHSDTPKTGDFDCSDPLINQLQKNIDWGQRGNFVDVPTDCPQRDERLGWTGDAQVFIRTAAFNRDVDAFFHKWLRDLNDAQGPEGQIPCIIPDTGVVTRPGGAKEDSAAAWADAATICPYTVYLTYGDKDILAQQYDSMVKYVEFHAATEKDGIRCYDGYDGFKGFGDWLALDGSGKTDGGTPKDLLATAFSAHSANLLSKMAAVLGKDDDAAKYRKRFETVREAFQKRYVTPSGLLAPGTQTSYVLALHFDLLPDELRPAAVHALVRDIENRGNKLATGFVGSSYLPFVLTAGGRNDVAYKLLHQTQWPSFLYAVTQGATTIWERWDGWTHDKGFQDVGMNSFNHYAYGAIGSWLYQVVAGIEIDAAQPGYKHILLKPQPGGQLTCARAYLETPYGHVESSWNLISDGMLEWGVIVPPGTTATAFVPTDKSADAVTESNQALKDASGITNVRAEAGAVVMELAPGKYRFAV